MNFDTRFPNINIESVEETNAIAKPPKSIAKPVKKVKEAVVAKTAEEEAFARFLQLEVGDGAASSDTIRNYLSHTKQYLKWCKENLVPVKDADQQDLLLYRAYLIEENLKPATITTKLNILRRFYQALLEGGSILTNPVVGVKAPKNNEDPAARITFLEVEELSYLFDYIDCKLAETKTNKQKLPLLRDCLLLGIMSLEGCRTIELHELTLENIVKQGAKTGLRVAAKRASRIVPLTENLAVRLNEYLEMRKKVLRRKIKLTDYVFVSLSNQNKGG